MYYFLGGILLLVLGYLTYGALIERIIGPDNRATPAVKHPDGVDYVVLPHWKNMLLQLLNIAGIGPVIGVILGIKFGEIVFLIIPVGNIIGGATHDFLAGMMSVREDGDNLPSIVEKNLGHIFSRIFLVFMSLVLLLVVAVFINVPAGLADELIPGNMFWPAVVVIFLYYIAATLFPVDKIIGKIYPFFGAMLLIGTFALFIALTVAGFKQPELLTETAAFRARMWTAANGQPILPMLFVTIACGIISGFHGTQCPIVARTMSSEHQSRAVFYGMMIVEGVIAMIWAGAAMAIYNKFPDMMAAKETTALTKITNDLLWSGLDVVTVIAVIILAITSGDTALRSLRMSVAEFIHLPQKPIVNRFIVCTPMVVLVGLLLWWSNQSASSFAQLWRYFAWANQVLAVVTLYAAAAWLFRAGKPWIVAAVPGLFMGFIVITYILWKPRPMGLGLPLETAYYFAAAIAVLLLAGTLAKQKTDVLPQK